MAIGLLVSVNTVCDSVLMGLFKVAIRVFGELDT